jgi:glutamate 5-kinase
MASRGDLDARKAVAAAKRIVVKIGTNTITRQKGSGGRISAGGSPAPGIDEEYIHRVAAELADLVRSGKEVILVTSGAIGMGARELGLAKKPSELAMKQACAAVGQPLLMEVYRSAFGVYGLAAAQLLVTRTVWDNRAAYLNLRGTLEKLLSLRVVPVFNENDTISTAEIGNAFGDNDRLSAYVASKIDADLLIILSDVDSLYDADPRDNPGAKPIPYVKLLDPELLAAAGGKGSEFSTGGMKTKLDAVSVARDAGCRVVIAHGRAPRAISRVLAGERLGTLFDAETGIKNRMRWLKNSQPQGRITIDEGALAAIREKNSLLPRGVISVEGSFDRGAVLLVNGAAKVVTSYSSAELAQVIGKKSGEVEAVLGKKAAHVVARPEDTVFLDE